MAWAKPIGHEGGMGGQSSPSGIMPLRSEPDSMNRPGSRAGKASWAICASCIARAVSSSGACPGASRVDRFLSGVAYLDGVHPSVIICRGYYTRTCVAAYDLVDGRHSLRWSMSDASRLRRA